MFLISFFDRRGVDDAQAGIPFGEVIDRADVVDDYPVPVAIDGGPGHFRVVGSPGFHVS